MDFKEYSVGEFDTEEQKKFRKEVRDWIDKNIGPRLAQPAEERGGTAEADLLDRKSSAASSLPRGGWLPSGPKSTGERDFPPIKDISLTRR